MSYRAGFLAESAANPGRGNWSLASFEGFLAFSAPIGSSLPGMGLAAYSSYK
jgi:hypothetical protein